MGTSTVYTLSHLGQQTVPADSRVRTQLEPQDRPLNFNTDFYVSTEVAFLTPLVGCKSEWEEC